jgi:L-aminopeptidase/D-esterase-like protein
VVEVGNYNGITDIEGLLVGHYTDKKAASGVSVVLCLQGATAAVDVRGAAPGTRETDLLDPSNLVQQAQAIVLTGGSVFGLAAADGVARWLAENGYGFPLGQEQVAPIVPAAVLFDLGRGAEYVPPVSAEWGRRACLDAKGGSVKMGNIGAATGALAGGVKGGLGTASYILDNGLGVAALVAVNSLGSLGFGAKSG